MLTIAYLNNILLHAEFSAMDYTLNIVSKCCFFFISKHSRAPKRSWKIFHGGPGKSWIFLSVKEWEPCIRVVLEYCPLNSLCDSVPLVALELQLMADYRR